MVMFVCDWMQMMMRVFGSILRMPVSVLMNQIAFDQAVIVR